MQGTPMQLKLTLNTDKPARRKTPIVVLISIAIVVKCEHVPIVVRPTPTPPAVQI